MAKKVPFSCLRDSFRVGVMGLRKNGLFLEFPLCLSRACLGQQFVLIYKWLKTTVFTHRPQPKCRSNVTITSLK